jgi:hypothetical protein
MASELAIAKKRSRITPRFVFLAIQKDPEFQALLKDVTVAQGKKENIFIVP